MQLGILFWFYKDPIVCGNRLRQLRRENPSTPIFGLFGGPPEDRERFTASLSRWLDDFWAYPSGADSRWKWRHGDALLSRWFTDRGEALEWDSVFVAQWDLVAVRPLQRLLPSMEKGDMLLSGLRPVREVESWWQWTQEPHRGEYEEFLGHVASRLGPVEDPMCCQFIAMVIPRDFLCPYAAIERPELGFLEYKVPVYAQAFGVPLVPDTCFRPWWPEEPATAGSKRTDRLVHAWGTQVKLPVIWYEAHRPGGRRAFHPYRGIYPHDLRSVGEAARARLGHRPA